MKLPELILNEICRTLELEKGQVLSKNRHRNNVEARFIAAYFVKQFDENITLQSVGKLLNIDHSTVIYAIKQTESLRICNSKFKEKFESCQKSLAFYGKEFDFSVIPQL